MKDKIVSGVGIVVVLLLIFVSVKYFKDGNPFAGMHSGKRMEIEQAGEPDKESIELAELFKEEVRMEIDPRNIVPVGKPISDGAYFYQVESWKISKEDPGYPLPKGMESFGEYYGLERDENGTITNEYSFLTVNMSVENQLEKETTDLIWGTMDLRSGSIGTQSIEYLGEMQPRKYAKNYYEETIPGKGKITMPLIFVVKDELLEGYQFFIEINRTGTMGGTLEDGRDARRLIALTE